MNFYYFFLIFWKKKKIIEHEAYRNILILISKNNKKFQFPPFCSWFRAVQDTDHIRSVKEKRMEKKEKERNKWRNEEE